METTSALRWTPAGEYTFYHHRYPRHKFHRAGPMESLCDLLDLLADAGVPASMADTYWGYSGLAKTAPATCENRVRFCAEHRITGTIGLSWSNRCHGLFDHVEGYKTADRGVFVMTTSPYNYSAEQEALAAAVGLIKTAPQYSPAATTWYTKGSRKDIMALLNGPPKVNGNLRA